MGIGIVGDFAVFLEELLYGRVSDGGREIGELEPHVDELD